METFSDGTSATTSATVTGLTNGVAYTFRIAATNAAGTSAYSSASTAVTPAGVPAAPDAPTPTAGNGSVSLSWTAPSANGSAITDYKVYYATSAGGSYTLFSDGTSTTASATVTGLTNGTSYYFKIAAVNAVGDSALSAASTASTPAAPPYFPPCFATCTPPACTFTTGTSTGPAVPNSCGLPGCNSGCLYYTRTTTTYTQGSCVDACGTTVYSTCPANTVSDGTPYICI
jgi:hypothetical protein